MPLLLLPWALGAGGAGGSARASGGSASLDPAWQAPIVRLRAKSDSREHDPAQKGADSAAAARDSLATTAGRVESRGGRRWEDGQPLGALGADVGRQLLARATLFHSSALTLSDAILRESELGMHRAGAHGAWDLPYRLGPGVDRLSLWFGGTPSTGAAVAEAHLHTLSPMLLQRARLIGPNPYLDPLGWSGDAMIWSEEPSPDPVIVRSAVRLCEGAGGVGTQEMWLTRLSHPWRLSGSYAHSSGDGRPSWVEPRYTGSQYQNLLATLDRSVGPGVVRVSAAGRDGKWTMEGGRKLVWESMHSMAGWQSGEGRATHFDLRLLRQNDLLRWWGAAGDARRRTTSTAILGRGAVGREALRLLWAAGAERVATALRLGSELNRSWTANGLGVATGVHWADSLTSLQITAGYCDPWWGEGHLRVHAAVARRLSGQLGATVAGWHNEGVAFTPRLEGDGEALLAEGVLLPGWTDASAVPQRRRDHLEMDLLLGAERRAVRGGLFVDRMRNGLGLDPSSAAQFAPELRDTQDVGELLGEVTLAGFVCSGRIALGGGAALGGDATWIVSPREEELPLLTPRARGRFVFSLGGRIFKNDLAWEGRLVYVARSSWLTPYGSLEARGRLDGEIHGTIGAAHLFLALRNIENAEQASATYADGLWAPLMLRSYQAGFEWQFRD